MMLFAVAYALPFGSNPVEACLRANDVPCAKRALEAAGAASTKDPDLLAMRAQVAFYDGDFPLAYDSLQAAVDGGWEDPWATLPLYERTLYATEGWTEAPVEGSRFRTRFLPGLDEVLLDGAGEALVKTEQHVTPLLGDVPPGNTLLEIYPDSKSFIAASSLTATDVRTTGVVALSKWSRLLVTSPRALARGYDWQNTIAHEYIHLVVAHNTDDRAPVWLQEAIAKYLDNRWKDGKDRWRLSVRDQGLLAQALDDDDLVTFDEMHPSLAKLPTAERAALAYAQVSALMAFCFEKAGEDVLLKALPLVRSGMDAREALAKGAGYDRFAKLEKDYLAWLRTLDLKRSELQELPTVFAEDGVDDGAIDPVLSRREDLHRFVRLGTLLRERDRQQAALVEYEKARDPDEPNSPYLSNMIAQTHLELKDVVAAERELAESVVDYPEFALTHKTLGAIRRARNDLPAAFGAYSDAAELNPYDPSVQTALIELADRLGRKDDADRARARLAVLREGGSDTDWKPLHDRSGDYILPGGAESSDAEGLEAAFKGEMAPQFRVKDLEGEFFTLGDLGGDVVVLDFWATWCGPCRAAIPHLKELNARKGVRVVGLSDELREKIVPYVAKNDVDYVIGVDKGGATKKRYEVASLPTVFVIDGRGRVEAVVVGAGPEANAALDAAVDAALQR